jgi:hypothetical protein
MENVVFDIDETWSVPRFCADRVDRESFIRSNQFHHLVTTQLTKFWAHVGVMGGILN